MSVRSILLAAALIAAPAAAAAQTSSEHVAQGDRAVAAFDVAAAQTHYEAAIAADPKDYEALWKAARGAVDLGEAASDEATRTKHFRDAELYARRAMELRPTDAEGHFHLARAIGRRAQSMGARDRVKFAGEVREHALEALKYDPKHPGALHVMGVWNAEVMRLSGFSRWAAKNLLGGKVFDSANWKEAVRYMEEAVAAEPNRITHHLDLGKIYVDVGDRAKARAEFEWIARAPRSDPNDELYKRDAARQAAKLK